MPRLRFVCLLWFLLSFDLMTFVILLFTIFLEEEAHVPSSARARCSLLSFFLSFSLPFSPSLSLSLSLSLCCQTNKMIQRLSVCTVLNAGAPAADRAQEQSRARTSCVKREAVCKERPDQTLLLFSALYISSLALVIRLQIRMEAKET